MEATAPAISPDPAQSIPITVRPVFSSLMESPGLAERLFDTGAPGARTIRADLPLPVTSSAPAQRARRWILALSAQFTTCSGGSPNLSLTNPFQSSISVSLRARQTYRYRRTLSTTSGM